MGARGGGRKRPAQIGGDTLAKVSVDASVGGVIGVPLAPPVQKARCAIPNVTAARDAVPAMAQSVDDAVDEPDQQAFTLDLRAG